MNYDLNVLIVDDEPEILEVIKSIVEAEVSTVLTANSGEEALELVANNQFDLVLSDVNMEGMNGIELVEKVLQEDDQAVCVLVTGYADKDIAIKALKIGAYDILEKPFSKTELIAVIERSNVKCTLNRETNKLIDEFLKEKLDKSSTDADQIDKDELKNMKEVVKHILALKKLNRRKQS